MLVSIVTPVKNAERFLAQTLESVRAQAHPHEHIVVDGGSTDGTLDLLRAAPGITWTSGADAGMYDAVNRGFRMAAGDVLAYQNGDDRYAGPDTLSRVVEVFDAHPDVDVVYGDFRYVDEEGRPLGETRTPDFDARALRRYNFIPPHSTFVRRRVVRDRSLWLDPELRFAGDWEWFLRMAADGRRFLHVPRVLSEFRRHARQITATVGWRGKLSEWRRICRRHGISLPLLVWNEYVYQPSRRRLGG
ncbi:MAG TPA: glycosyltransferase family 2 protein [Vicinamibacteria bacterium]|nr:glycosyltransferase family 2 protein [Vicinamibacteria bacterium]